MAQKWKDKLRPASFRGIKFFVDVAQYQGGRRGPLHEFPDRDDPYREDTGRRARKYDIEGYLVGSEYLAGKKSLISACEKAGPGDLIHPYYGRVRVVCDTFSVQETSGTGGFVKFSFQFVEAGKLSFPKSGSDSISLVGAAADALSGAGGDSFGSAFDVAGQAAFMIDSAAEKVEGFADELDAVTAGLTGSASSIAELAFAIRNLKSAAKDLVNKPSELSAQMSSAMGLLAAASDPSDVFAACGGLFGFGDDDPTIPQTTSSRTQQVNNHIALNTFVQVLAVSTASSAAVEMEHASVEDATEVQTAISDQLDNLMESTTDDTVYSALQGLRSEVVNAIPGTDENLARVAEMTPFATIPSLVLAYDLYGDVDNEQDIIDRNRIQHPGFIQGGVPLEVLDRG